MKICPACNSKEQKHLGFKNGFDLLRCTSCQTLYSESKENAAFDYTTYYDEDNLDIPEFVKGRLAEIVSEFDGFRKNNRLLDIGCGAGYLLEEAKKQNWATLGTEISDSAVANLRNRNIEVFQGDLAEKISEHNLYDVVVSTEVLEHITEPFKLVETAYKLLRDGGLFWGTTPNGKGLSTNLLGQRWSVIAPPEHIQLFSKFGLKKMLKKAGFRTIKIRAQGVNPLEIYQHFRDKIRNHNDDNQIAAVRSESFDRVETSYQINATLSQGFAKTLIKVPTNMILNTTGLGDSLKFWATK